MCAPTNRCVCVCVWVVGQLTHTEGELYPLNVLHRKHVYSSCLCVAAWFEMESITSFPGRKGRVAQGERRNREGSRRAEREKKQRITLRFRTQSAGSEGSRVVYRTTRRPPCTVHDLLGINTLPAEVSLRNTLSFLSHLDL